MKIEQLENDIVMRTDLGDGCEGMVAINSTFANTSTGGLRIAEDITLDEVRTLAREMTVKFALFDISSGGAKAGLRIPKGTRESKRNLLLKFGQILRPLIRRGVYYPWMDINCNRNDIQLIYEGAGFRISPSTDTGLFTAISVLDTLVACRKHLGEPLKPTRLAIEGFGNVAAHLAKRLPPDQFIITAISTIEGSIINENGFPNHELAYKKEQFGDELINHLTGTLAQREKIFGADVDIFLPGARTWSLTEETAPQIRASYIVPIANAPYGDNSLNYLETKGVICFPGYLVNAGGVFGSSLFDSGVPLKKVEGISATHFRSLINMLLTIRSQQNISLVSITGEIAEDRMSTRKDPYRNKSPLMYTARTFAQNTFIPKYFLGRARAHRFINALNELEKQFKSSS
jgi:glutamate dehydrogenase (NAD(P)+)